MALIVEIKVNDTLIAKAVAGNVSQLADISNYVVRGVIDSGPFNDNVTTLARGMVKNHDRNSPVWDLVRKMMEVLINDPAPVDFSIPARNLTLPPVPQKESFSRSKTGADLLLTVGTRWPGS